MLIDLRIKKDINLLGPGRGEAAKTVDAAVVGMKSALRSAEGGGANGNGITNGPRARMRQQLKGAPATHIA